MEVLPVKFLFDRKFLIKKMSLNKFRNKYFKKKFKKLQIFIFIKFI